MEVFFTPSILWGPLRIILFIFFIYIINIIIVRKASKRRGLDYFMLRFPLLVSVLIITTLILTQINTYDLFVILFLFTLIAILRLLDFDIRKPIKKQLKKTQKRFILYIIRSFEHKERLLSKKNLKKFKKLSKNNTRHHDLYDISKTDYYQQIIIISLLSLLVFGARYYFFHFDTYLLSDIWYNDLGNLKNIGNEKWFFHPSTMMGLFSIINFYNEITGIADAVALTSFSLIESVLVSISIFWFVNKLTKSKITPGLIAVLSYIFLYPIIPINIGHITQPKSINFGFTLVLPLIVYSYSPKNLTLNSKKYFRIMFAIIFGIMHVDLFLTIYILPFILTIAMLFNYKKYNKLMANLFKSYILVIGISLFILFIASIVQEKDLITFINSNLYSYKNYTYAPHLIFSLKKLLNVYLIITFALILISTYLWRIDKKNKPLLMISLLIACIFSLPKLHVSFIDTDLLNQVFSILIPILIGLSSYSLYTLSILYITRPKLSVPFKAIVALIIFVTTSLSIAKLTVIESSKNAPINIEVIKVYDQMNNDLLPFSYGVVNNYMNARLGDDSHFFLNYSYFSKDYILKDELFNTHKGDKAYFKKNPEHILPQSIFVFIYDNKVILDVDNGLTLQEQKAALSTINVLKNKGRNIQIYYKTPLLTVYEIINQPESSKIIDLLL